MFIIEKIFVSSLIQAGSYPLPSTPACQEARPEGVGAVGGDGVVTQGQQRQIEGGRQGRGSGDLGVQQ